MTNFKVKIDKKIWTPLLIKVDLDGCLTRKVLFEKQPSPEKAKKIEMAGFFMSKLNGCELFKHKDYQDSVFYIKNNGGIDGGKNEILFEKDEKKRCIYINYRTIWQVFESKYGLNYTDIQSFTQDTFEEGLISDPYKTANLSKCSVLFFEEGLISDPYKTYRMSDVDYLKL